MPPQTRVSPAIVPRADPITTPVPALVNAPSSDAVLATAPAPHLNASPVEDAASTETSKNAPVSISGNTTYPGTLPVVRRDFLHTQATPDVTIYDREVPAFERDAREAGAQEIRLEALNAAESGETVNFSATAGPTEPFSHTHSLV